MNQRSSSDRFNPKALFGTLGKLVQGTNDNGYVTALDRYFSDADTPTPSALCQYRQTVSFEFFSDTYKQSVEQWKRYAPKWKGYSIQAIDGDRLYLPASEEVLEAGYRGTPTKEGKETYYPAMYYCAATDVISGVPVGFSYSTENDEIARALDILETSNQSKLISIYDRFYMSRRLLDFYKNNRQQFFICRVKTGSTFTEIVNFAESDKATDRVKINGVSMRLLKAQHCGGDEFVVATNLGLKVTDKEIIRLYSERWDSETGNRDRTQSMKIEQFRSLKINGILQELFVALSMECLTKSLIALETDPFTDFMKEEYRKSNFKAVVNKIGDSIGQLLDGPSSTLKASLSKLIQKTIAKRQHFSREYERMSRRIIGKLYKHESLITRRE